MRSVITMRSVIAVVIALSCAGCGSASAVDGGRSTAPPYKGPLTAGAAVDALECDGTKPFLRSTGEYDDGLATVQSSAQDAFDNYIEESSVGYSMPLEGYRIERSDAGHALLSYDVGERTKVSVVLADGIRDWDDDVGWGVVAWAQCDPAEFPAEVTDDLGIGVWEDASGQRVPFTRVHSRQGPEHCSWTDITFLLIGPDDHRADWYVRDATGEFQDARVGVSRCPRHVRRRCDAAEECDLHRLAPWRAPVVAEPRQAGGLPGRHRRSTRRRALAGCQGADHVRLSRAQAPGARATRLRASSSLSW